ncbi:hypothetical protein E7X58_08120 [Streptomyces sp. A1499]|nr:hypothetical protein E7X58_08120 [Streptomyces sp. A1499]
MARRRPSGVEREREAQCVSRGSVLSILPGSTGPPSSHPTGLVTTGLVTAGLVTAGLVTAGLVTAGLVTGGRTPGAVRVGRGTARGVHTGTVPGRAEPHAEWCRGSAGRGRHGRRRGAAGQRGSGAAGQRGKATRQAPRGQHRQRRGAAGRQTPQGGGAGAAGQHRRRRGGTPEAVQGGR